MKKILLCLIIFIGLLATGCSKYYYLPSSASAGNGTAGPQGPPGPAGLNGTNGINGTNGLVYNITNIFNITNNLTVTHPTAILILPVNLTNSTRATTYTELFVFSLLGQKNYTLECKIPVAANITTTGVQFLINTTTVPNWMTIFYDHPTTATAAAYTTCSSRTNWCADGSITSLLYPAATVNRVYGTILANNTGILNISFRSEVANWPAFVLGGAYCKVDLLEVY